MNTVMIGVLSLQGAVEEHLNCLRSLGYASREIKGPSDLNGVDGIILPGGESTAMAILGEKNGIFEALRDWVASSGPVWGTCAGMILLSDHAIKQATGGQSLLGGLDAVVCRNYFGSQIQSCEKTITMNVEGFSDAKGVFIRAPAILKTGAAVKVLGTVVASPHTSASTEVATLLAETAADGTSFVSHRVDESDAANQYMVAVAVRQGNILATAFHPELSDDLRWHRYFVEMVLAARDQRLGMMGSA